MFDNSLLYFEQKVLPMRSFEYWMNKLQLKPHPEGGYFRETYRSDSRVQQIDTSQMDLPVRSACTSIFYLLGENDISMFHRLSADEIWYFHHGTTLLIHSIDHDGEHLTHRLGSELHNGDTLCQIIPSETWFGAELEDKSGFALVSCVVAPGFEFDDFEMAERETLLSTYPQHAEVISRLTPMTVNKG